MGRNLRLSYPISYFRPDSVVYHNRLACVQCFLVVKSGLPVTGRTHEELGSRLVTENISEALRPGKLFWFDYVKRKQGEEVKIAEYCGSRR